MGKETYQDICDMWEELNALCNEALAERRAWYKIMHDMRAVQDKIESDNNDTE